MQLDVANFITIRLLEHMKVNLAELLLIVPNLVIKFRQRWNDRLIIYDIDKICPKLRVFENHHSQLQTEYRRIKNFNIPSYKSIDIIQKRIAQRSVNGAEWKVLMFEFAGRKFANNRKICPITSNYLDQIPRIFQAFYSVLEAGKSIPSHRSPYNGYLRCHIGIDIPPINPPQLLISDELIEWQNGVAILIDDTWQHEVINNSPQDRVVLIVDIARPMNQLGMAIHNVLSFMIRHTYARYVASRSTL